LDIVRIQFFLEVAKHLNFSEASKHLYVSQSALSKQIALLEKELGVKLFTRDKRSVELTSSGHIFLNKATELLNLYKEAVISTQKANKGFVGTLNIGILGYIEFIPKFLRMFHETYPSIELRPIHMNSGTLINSILNKEIDLAFTLSLGEQKFPNLIWEMYTSDEIVVTVPNDHSLSSRETIHLSELSDELFVAMSRSEAPEHYDFFVKLCEMEGFSPKIPYQVDRMETLFMIIDSGLAISILPKCVTCFGNGNRKLIRIEGLNTTYNWGIVMHKDNQNSSLPLLINEFKRFHMNIDELRVYVPGLQ